MEHQAEAIYIHIPFCERVCAYCDFAKLKGNRTLEEEYIAALEREIASNIPEGRYKTLFIGGGTPTSLDDDLFSGLLSYLRGRFDIQEEFTVEGNPESVSVFKARKMKECGVNRVSLGVQSFDPEILKILGREEKSEEYFVSAVKKLQDEGISNINGDFIYGLKAEKKEWIDKQIEAIAALKLTHASFYALQIEKRTPLWGKDGLVKDDDGLRADYDYIKGKLREIGLERYEVSNFAREGFASRHNLTYWHNEPYYASGLGATSYVGALRENRTSVFQDYIKGQKIIVSSIHDDKADEEFNYLMLNLRLDSGFSLEDFANRFGKDFLKAYQKELESLSEHFICDQGRFRVKEEDIYILDSLLVDLLHFKA